MATTKLERLEALRRTLVECKRDCVKDADEWQFYDGIMAQVKDQILQEQHRLGYMAVYAIEDGMAANPPLYVGTSDGCDLYVSILFEGHPEMKGNIIITNI